MRNLRHEEIGPYSVSEREAVSELVSNAAAWVEVQMHLAKESQDIQAIRDWWWAHSLLAEAHREIDMDLRDLQVRRAMEV